MAEGLDLNFPPLEEEPHQVIRITEDRERLKHKLDEYRGRLESDDPIKRLDATYKIAVAELLVEQGEVDVDALEAGLREQYGEEFSSRLFSNAAEVIKDYISYGGKHNIGGTGLPK